MGIRRFTSSSSNKSTSTSSSGSKSSLYSNSKQFMTRAAQNLHLNSQPRPNAQFVQNYRVPDPGPVFGQSSQSNGLMNFASSSTSGATDPSLNAARNPQNPVAFLQQRIQLLEEENRRVMSNQGRLIGESNRRLDLHLNEIRALKEELKSLKSTNENLRNQCQHIEGERIKAHRLGQEWERFGKYSNELMKQEIRSYQVRVGELEAKKENLLSENADLKRLCIYLDEQRQTLLQSLGTSRETFFPQNSDDSSPEKYGAGSEPENSGETSEDAGCGSSAASSNSGCDDTSQEIGKSEFRRENNGEVEREFNPKRASVVSFNQEQERALRSITDQISSTSITDQAKDNSSGVPYSQNVLAAQNQRVFDYIHSLESRIRQLEQSDKRPLSPIPTSMLTSLERECRSASPSISSGFSSRFTFDRYCASVDVLQSKAEGQFTENARILPFGSQRPEISSAGKLVPVHVLSEVPLSPGLPRFLRMGLSRLAQESGSMAGSMTNSSMTTSSGTAYCSSSEDAESDSTATTILVVGDETMDNSAFFNNNLEVRPLGTIEEEDRDETDTEDNYLNSSETSPENRVGPTNNGKICDDLRNKEKLEVEIARSGPSSKAESEISETSPEVFIRTRKKSQNELLPEEKMEHKNQSSANRISSSSTGSAFSASSTFSSYSGMAECESPDLDLPPSMPPLISESKRFSLCSTSNMSDNFSTDSGSTTSLNKFVRMPTKIPFPLNNQTPRCAPAQAQYLLRQQSPRPERKLFVHETHFNGAQSGPPPVPTRIRVPPTTQPIARGVSSFQPSNEHLQTFRNKEFETIHQNGTGLVKQNDMEKRPIWQTAWSSLDRKGMQADRSNKNHSAENCHKLDLHSRPQTDKIQENNYIEAHFTAL